MRREILAITFTTAALALPGCGGSSAESTPEPIAPTEPAPHASASPNYLPKPPEDILFKQCIEGYFKKRQQIPVEEAENRLEAATKLAKKVKNPDVRSVGKFLGERMNFTHPKGDDVPLIVLERGGDYDCQPFKNLTGKTTVFGFSKGNPKSLTLVTDNKQPVSEFWGGVVTLHEGKHIDTYNKETVTRYDEREARLFEQSIISEVGGKHYRKLLDTIKERMRQRGFNQANNYKIHIGNDNMTNDEIDEIFGESISPRDNEIRRGMIQVHAVFELADELFADPQVSAQMQQDFVNQFQGRALKNISPYTS